MGKKIRRNPDEIAGNDKMDMTPMIDVVFLLIIFFMCVTEMSDASRSKLELPLATKSEEVTYIPGRIIINVLKNGDIELMRNKISEAELERTLRAYANASKKTLVGSEIELPDQAVLIRADRDAHYSAVEKVMDLCRIVKIWKIAYATKDSRFQ